MAANQNVVDELVVKITLDASEYKKVDKEVDKLATTTERKAKRTDNDRIKRTKESTAAVKQFAGSLKSLALTIGGVLGVAGGVTGLIGSVVALTNFETSLRRTAVSTGLSNRELQAWGSAARRLGADAQAGAAAIADLAREQKQAQFGAPAPTIAALSRLGVNIGPNTNIQDVLAQAQQIYRGSSTGQKGQIEAGLSAQGVSNDLILLIKSEKDVREEYTRSFKESAEESRGAMDAVTNALEGVKNSAINVANTIAAIVQPNVEAFAQWVSTSTSNLSAFNERVQAAGGGIEGFMKVLDTESPALAAVLRELEDEAVRFGEVLDVATYGFQSLYKGLQALYTWIDQKFGVIFGGGSGQVKGAVNEVRDWFAKGWEQLVRDARREGAAPIGTVTGSAGGVKLTPEAQARIAAGELNGRKPATRTGLFNARPSAQEVMQYLISAGGLNAQQAAAVAASIQKESNFDPTAINLKGGGQGARGLFQHRGPRIDAFRARYGINPDQATWQQQLDFVLTNPYERGLLNKSLAGPGGAAAIGTNFSRIFEAHGDPIEDARRGMLAQQLAQQYNPATGGTGGPQVSINGPVSILANNPSEFFSGIQRVSNTGNYQSAVR